MGEEMVAAGPEKTISRGRFTHMITVITCDTLKTLSLSLTPLISSRNRVALISST